MSGEQVEEGEPQSSEEAGRATQQESARLPSLPWCSDCWDQAAEGTQADLNSELPEECQHCGSNGVFWI